jgi:transcriptional regulatory protein GAL4
MGRPPDCILPSPIAPTHTAVVSPTSSFAQFDHPSASSTASGVRSGESRSHSRSRRQTGGIDTTAEFERNPLNATGYEYNERRVATKNDGTASLSVEPDGAGYLGFASGAMLLRILQIMAGGVLVPPTTIIADEPIPVHWEPSHFQLTRFIDAYFNHYHTQYPIVHKPIFEAQWTGVIAKPPPVQ